MKKKLLIALGLLVIVVAGIGAYVASNANALIAKYKPDLERIASSALHSHVTLGTMQASVFPSVKVRIDEFHITRSPESKDGLSLKNLMLHVRLLPLLTGNLTIVKLSLDSPQLTFLKDSSGISIEGLPKAEATQAAVVTTAAPVASEHAGAGPVPAGLGLNLDAFELRNAKITLRDVSAGKEFHLSNLNVTAALDFENNTVHLPSLSITGKALDAVDFKVSGKPIRFGLGDGEFQVSGISVSTLDGQLDVEASGNVNKASGKARISSSGFDLAKLTPAYNIIPALKDLALQGKVTPVIDADWGKGGAYTARGAITLTAVGATAAGVTASNLSGKINLDANQSAQMAEASDLKLNIGTEPATLSFASRMANEEAQLTSLKLDAFGGKVEATARVGVKDQRFASQFSVAGVAIEKALAALKPGMAGLLSGTAEKVAGDVAGTLGADLKQSLQGTASVLVKNGSIIGVNIASQVLSAVKGLPFLSGSLLGAAPPEKRAALESPNTEVGSLSGDFRIANAALATQNFQLVSSLFSLAAQGSAGFDAHVNMNAQIAFDPVTSASMVLKYGQLKNLQDQNGRIVIPLSITGTPPAVLLLPDLEKITTLAAQAALKHGAEKLLGDVLKKGGGEAGKKKGLGGLLGF